MKSQQPEIVKVDEQRVAALLQCVDKQLEPEDAKLVTAILKCYVYILPLISNLTAANKRLLKWLFGSKSEKTNDVLGNAQEGTSNAADDSQQASPVTVDTQSTPDDASSPSADVAASEKEKSQRQSPPGHGRNGADAFRGAQQQYIEHETLEPGSSCPECGVGTVYESKPPGVVIHLTGGAPLGGTVIRLQKLRCNLCGKVYTAEAPVRGGPRVYDETAVAMVGLLRYGTGLPFHRLERLQQNLGIPLPASTQWDIIQAHVRRLVPVYLELIRYAAQGELFHNDDTTARILCLMGKRKQKNHGQTNSPILPEMERGELPDDRTGIFTTAIVSVTNEHQIVLFFTGRHHAGENLALVLKQRIALVTPMLMCDGLSRNLPKELEMIVANCLAHGRRHFVDLVDDFPDEVRFVLESLKVVYENDARARREGLTPQDRLQFHQAHSQQTMDDLHDWMKRQLDEKRVEPNSGLGGAINYMLERWDKLTLFLRQAGAPLDNNICERGLKKAIIHRRNSLFYKTQYGALVGDIHMSLIYTCELCGGNPLHYLTQLLSHPEESELHPDRWMPWNYQQTLAEMGSALGNDGRPSTPVMEPVAS